LGERFASDHKTMISLMLLLRALPLAKLGHDAFA